MDKYLIYLFVNENSNIDLFSIITTIATLLALFTAIYQSYLSRITLNETKTSIEEDKKSRQLSMIPKMEQVTLMKLDLERWLKKLKEVKADLIRAKKEKKEDLFKKISAEAPKKPSDVMMYFKEKYVFDNVSQSIKTIVISGAQYYYNVTSAITYVWIEDKGINWTFIEGSLFSSIDDSIRSIEELNNLVNQMVPDVLVETPASISESKFFTD